MEKKALAIVVGGGPAPGINGVISSVAINAINRGHRVLGVHKGFRNIMKGDRRNVDELNLANVSWIHARGGSILGTSRANPTKDPEHLRNVVESLKALGVGYLVSIGGDDTAHSARIVAEVAGGEIAVGHVPKTIDNDLPLPGFDSTFGYQTARAAGTEIVETLMEDAKTTSRWYLVIAMGRKAGHLALGIGISSGATMTIIPEEFGPGNVSLSMVVDTIVGSMIKRLAEDKPYGVVVLAEGLAEKVTPDSIPELANAERDPHGHIRYRDLDFGHLIKMAVKARLAHFGADIAVIDKDVGYELRCRPPIPFDREYTRELGFGIADFLLRGGSNAMISRQGDRLVAIPFTDLIDAKTGKTQVRYVDVHSSVYRVARKYMMHLTEEDLADPNKLDGLVRVTKVSSDVLKTAFAKVARHASRNLGDSLEFVTS